MNKTNNLRAYLRDLYEGIVSKKPDASRNPQNFRSEIEAIRTGGELYEVMDASELPEDAPNGSLALVEGEPIPEAYTVSSVDELPSNAVDGSMAIVPSDSIVGTWVFNETLNFDHIKLPNNGDWLRVECCGYSNLTNNFDGFAFRNDGGSIIFQAMRDIFNEESDIYDLYYDGMWDDQMPPFEIYRFDGVATLNNEGTSMPDGYGSTEEDFIAWLKANTNRISGGHSLYTRDNGQWVYKCEVV